MSSVTSQTSVPAVVFGPQGFVAPQESAILLGALADFNAAFGGNLNPSLSTPQGQLCSSLAAIIGMCNDLLCSVFNGVDPAMASGRMQDAIARIYFLQRNQATSTVVSCTCTGLANTQIPFGALAVDTSGNIYAATQASTIPASGSIAVQFAAQNTGPLACPANSLTTIYQAIPGWDTITNAAPGIEGNIVESREDFETRRQQSVFLNSIGSNPSVLAAILAVPGVLSAYVVDNPSNITSGASFSGSITNASPAVLTVGGTVVGTVLLGHMITGAGVAQGTIIINQLTGTTGGAGTYTVNISQAIGTEAMQSSFGGVPIPANSIYIAAIGGSAPAIAQAIFTKKSPGCPYYPGNTTVTVYDTSTGYAAPYPAYAVTFEIPPSVPIFFSVTLKNNLNVPSNALALIQAAIIAVFEGQSTVPPAVIGSTVFGGSYYPAIIALGSWVNILSITVGIAINPTATSIAMQINQVPTISAGSISLTLD